MTRRYPDLSDEDYAQEQRVAAFMREAEAADSERVKAVAEKHMVLTDDQLDYRREHELHAFSPIEDLDDGEDRDPNELDDLIVSDAASQVRHDEELAARRMEDLGLGPYSNEPHPWLKPELEDADLLRAFCAGGREPDAVRVEFPHWTPYRLKAAKKAAGIKSDRTGFGPGSRVVWRTA
jgi:hypothetical protein